MTRKIGRASWCKHYRGMYQHKTCKAGVAHDGVRDSSQSPYRWPCTDMETGGCDKLAESDHD